MASRGKKKTTMAKLTRESRLRERRLDKAARKDARKRASAEYPGQPGDIYADLPGDTFPDESDDTAADQPGDGQGDVTSSLVSQPGTRPSLRSTGARRAPGVEAPGYAG